MPRCWSSRTCSTTRSRRGYAPRRRRALEAASARAGEIQERTLQRLVAAAARTEFGREHGFGSIRSVADYQARVPVRDYPAFRLRWARALAGESDVTWPGCPRHWVKTSGTTTGDKVIPVTPEAFASHRRGGWGALLMAGAGGGGPPPLRGGPISPRVGSPRLSPIGADARVGDLSGLVIRRLPPGVRGRYSPGAAISAIPDWETRIR